MPPMHRSMLKRSFVFKSEEGDNLAGYAFRFSETADGFFGKERFSPDLQVEYADPCLLLRDHNPERLLARQGQNFQIRTDKEGLYFSATLPQTDLAKETQTLIKSKILNGASVGFEPITERTDDQVNVFEKIKLYEISLVPRPYYSSSEVAARHNKTLKHRVLPPELYL